MRQIVSVDVFLVNQHIHFNANACLTGMFLGFMQFVQSVPVAEVLATEGNIQVQSIFCPVEHFCQSSTGLPL